MTCRFYKHAAASGALRGAGETAKAVGDVPGSSITSLTRRARALSRQERSVNESVRGRAGEICESSRFIQPSLRDLGSSEDGVPNVKTLSYFRGVPSGPGWRGFGFGIIVVLASVLTVSA